MSRRSTAHTARTASLAVALVVALVLPACAGNDDAAVTTADALPTTTAAPSTTVATTAAPTATTIPATTGVATTIPATTGVATTGAGTTAAPVATDTVQIIDFSYQPATITVKVGQKVTWTNKDTSSHSATGNGFDTGVLDSGTSAGFPFEQPGEYRYICAVHGATMQGTVVVTA